MSCDHEPSTNPRHTGVCVRCGRPIPQPPRQARNPQFERQLTRELAQGLSVDPEPLIAYAEGRANHAEQEYGHGFPAPDRNLVYEAIQELSDGRNYLGWELERLQRTNQTDSAPIEQIQRAYRQIILAFEELRQAL